MNMVDEVDKVDEVDIHLLDKEGNPTVPSR